MEDISGWSFYSPKWLPLYLTSIKTYKISSLLQVQSPQQSFDPRKSLNLDFYNAAETNIDNLIKLYSSRSNILELIKSLNLNLEIKNSDDTKFLDISTFLLKKDEKNEPITFYLRTKDNSFNLLDDKKKYSYGRCEWRI